MTALLAIDTATRRVRRYISQVHAGVRKVYATHELNIQPPLLTAEAEIA